MFETYKSPVAVLVLAFVGSANCFAGDRAAQITRPIDENDRTTINGTMRKEMTAANDRGEMPTDVVLTMSLQLKRATDVQRDMDELVNELHDRNSPRYHRWLTSAQIAEQFAPAEEDIQQVKSWLELHGFNVDAVYRATGVVQFSGPAGAVAPAFSTAIHSVSVNGKTYLANASEPSIPVALSAAVQGVVSMNNFRPHAMSRKRSHYTFACQAQGPACAQGTSHWYGVVPNDLHTIYGMTPLYAAGITGAGQTIVLLEDSDVYDPADWSAFRKTFGLSQRFPKGTFAQVHPQPPAGSSKGAVCQDPGDFGDDFEAILDAEWASAAAPNARIVLASCLDSPVNLTSGVLIALQNLLASNGPAPAIVSDSFGGGESEDGPTYNAFIRSLYEVAVLEGVSLFVASGDGGADDDNSDLFAVGAKHGVNAIGFGSTPFNVSVGGTDFADTYLREDTKYWRSGNDSFFGSALSYIPEIPWNASCASQLNASFFGFPKTYGIDGFCNASANAVVESVAGSGAPSGCAYGAARVPGVVGGTCKGYEKPVWQRWIRGNPSDGVRDVPDVSLFASNGIWGHYYVVCYSNTMPTYFGRPCVGAPSNWAGGGGTSFASPVMAGIQALVNEATGERQGNPNFVYYALAALEYENPSMQVCDATLGSRGAKRCVFHDVTLGDNNVDCSPLLDANGVRVGMFNCYSPGGELGVMSESNSRYVPLYKAGPGWDFASGLGSVNAYNLVRAWPGSKLRK